MSRAVDNSDIVVRLLQHMDLQDAARWLSTPRRNAGRFVSAHQSIAAQARPSLFRSDLKLSFLERLVGI